MRDVAIGALLGAVLAVFVHLAAIHSRTHHDAHHATSAIHQALKRAAPRKRFLPFFEGCAPSQTCARNLVERPRSRLEGAPGDEDLPEDLEEFEVLLERFGIFEDLMHVA